MIADRCLELLKKELTESESSRYFEINSRAKAVKGLVELSCGNPESGELQFVWLLYMFSFLFNKNDMLLCSGTVL